MIRYAAFKVGRVLLVLFVVTLATTLMLELLGDPARTIAGEEAPEELVENVRELYGFDEPVVVRYFNWLKDAVTLDFGSSYTSKQPVWDSIVQRLPVTIELAVLAMCIALAVSIPTAIATARRQNSRLDRYVGVATSSLIAIPTFLIGLLLVFVFAIKLHWMPVSGWVRLTESVGENLHHALLPALAMATSEIVIFQRVLHADLSRTLQDDFILFARAKGLSSRYILFRHALRPSMFSLVTLAGLSLGRTIGGTVVVETLFALPGLGPLLITSILNSDIVVVQALVTLIAVIVVLINVVVDLLYTRLDSRVRRAS